MIPRALVNHLVLCVILLGCGGAAKTAMRPSSPFTAQDAQLFEDAVEFVSDPDALTGRWGDDWAHDLTGRAASSDLIARVKVTTLETQIDPQQRTTFRLTTQILQTLKGGAPDQLSLTVADDAPGYSSIDPGRARLVSEEFIVFAKWYTKADGTVGAHWHLSIASPQVTSRVRAELDRDQPAKTTILKTNVIKN